MDLNKRCAAGTALNLLLRLDSLTRSSPVASLRFRCTIHFCKTCSRQTPCGIPWFTDGKSRPNGMGHAVGMCCEELIRQVDTHTIPFGTVNQSHAIEPHFASLFLQRSMMLVQVLRYRLSRAYWSTRFITFLSTRV